jgi:hypothetical protein
MEHLLIAAGVAALVGVVAFVLQRRLGPDGPTQPRHAVPAQLDRADFARPEAAWLVALFSSSTCLSCADTWDKVRQLESRVVAVDEVEVTARRDLHARYGIDAVPIVVVADADGVVRASFIGPPSTADLWATVAELRDPGSAPSACDHHASAPATAPGGGD